MTPFKSVFSRFTAMFALALLVSIPAFCQKETGIKSESSKKTGIPAPKPLFVDPVYDGAADPVVVWNRQAKKWYMLYTNRRANLEGTDGVSWVHGTRIGVATSKDGANWNYMDTCDIDYRPNEGYTHWAPDVVYDKGLYHMFLTYVPGIFSDWRHPRDIIHLTSKDLLHWKYQSTLKLASDRVIDASVFRLDNGSWRMYYNNERAGKSMFYADSPDLYNWTDSGTKVVGDKGGEGAKVFRWKGKNWMIVDNWDGLGIYSSEDMIKWQRQPENILREPGTGKDDGAKGQHCDVVVSGDRAYVYYFVHQNQRITRLQVAELEYVDGKIVCDRNKPTFVKLLKPKK
jgi:sucrose-6-phosphate hydrolase SacC (GH32 family)